MSSPGPVRNSQRTVRACTACVRRKIRCSKTIPCTACLRQNKATSCTREPVAVVTRRSTASRRSSRGSSSQPQLASGTPEADTSERLPLISAAAPITEPGSLPADPTRNVESQATGQALPEITNRMLMQLLTSTSTPESRLTNEAAAALEFLAHGRRNVLNRFVGRESVGHPTPPSPRTDNSSGEHWDTSLPVEDARMLLALHQAHLSWMHNAVHLPTFRREFDENVPRNDCDKSWIALYYALISHTLYHIDHGYLSSLPQPILADSRTSRSLFDKSIETLYQSGFMDDHKLTSVQAICLLLQVAHNFDKSDLICVLISTAIRISQCLNLHRLGPDRTAGQPVNTDGDVQRLIDREIHKRVWWFLVHYDWFQIPFQNTCQIHPAQFNTPMPSNCNDDAQRMVKDGVVVSHPADACTSSSWANSLNQLSVVIWKHQDRMFKVGYSGDDPETRQKLYEQVIWADQEIKSLYYSWPLQMRELDENRRERLVVDTFPVGLMPTLVLVCIAHKILSVHRCFHLSGFRDRRFAFSQLSCIAIAERSIEAIQRWPDNLETRIARKMWTTLTHVISCCITLVFALLFKSQNALTHDLARIRSYVEFGKEFISLEQQTSSIARRGVRLLGALMDLEQRSEYSIDLEADIGDLVRRFAVADDNGTDLNAAEAQQVVFPCEQELWESFMGDPLAGEFLGV